MSSTQGSTPIRSDNPNQVELHPVEMTGEEAAGSLNYFELQGMRSHFGIGLSDAETQPEAFMYALVWAMEKRTNSKIPAKVIQNLALTALEGYFQDEDPDQTEDSEQGKESTPDA